MSKCLRARKTPVYISNQVQRPENQECRCTKAREEGCSTLHRWHICPSSTFLFYWNCQWIGWWLTATEKATLLCLLIQMVISSETPSQTHLETIFSQLSGCPSGESSWHIWWTLLSAFGQSVVGDLQVQGQWRGMPGLSLQLQVRLGQRQLTRYTRIKHKAVKSENRVQSTSLRQLSSITKEELSWVK